MIEWLQAIPWSHVWTVETCKGAEPERQTVRSPDVTPLDLAKVGGTESDNRH